MGAVWQPDSTSKAKQETKRERIKSAEFRRIKKYKKVRYWRQIVAEFLLV